MPSKVVVTGGAGFIGSHLVEALVEKGHEIIVIDNLFTGKEKNIAPVMNDIEFVHGDILDSKLLGHYFENADYVFHEAALRSVRISVSDPHTYNNVNINGTLNVLMAARNRNVKRVIFASSSSIYENPKTFPVVESLNSDSQSPYALSKIVGEYYCQLYYQLFGLEIISLRYFNVYGPRQDFQSQYAVVIPVFIYQILHDLPLSIFGTDNQSLDFLYVFDVVDANLSAMNAPKPVCGQAFNVYTGNSLSVNDLAFSINSALGKEIKATYLEGN